MEEVRIIKFRAWDSNKKQMWYGVESWEDFGLIVYSQGKYVNWVLMQHIGLKDKYNREIYEGDIVHDNDDLYGERYGVVVWIEDGFYIDSINNSEWYDHLGKLFSWDEVEVIGNIYEGV